MQRPFCTIAASRLLIAGILAAMPACDRHKEPTSTQSAAAGKLTLAASVFPVADLVSRVAGDRWQVVTLLPPGRNPHGYSLRPAEAESLVRAKMLFAAGVGLDGWAIRAAAGINPQCKVIVLSEAMRLTGQETGGRSQAAAGSSRHGNGHGAREETDEQEGEEADAHHGMDPHIWLDPVLAGRMADLAADELTREDPAGREVYQQNSASLKQQLTVLDEEYRTSLALCRTRKLVVFHPGYGFLARRYGLEQVAVAGGAGANPVHIEEIIDLIKREHIRAVYREPQFDSRWVNFISERSGAKVLVLDPQGHAGKEGYNSYFALMRSNLAALKEGLDGGT